MIKDINMPFLFSTLASGCHAHWASFVASSVQLFLIIVFVLNAGLSFVPFLFLKRSVMFVALVVLIAVSGDQVLSPLQ